ncbi:thioredoxin family protein [Cocleimonas sp. KMM 6892]|uniref:thioredoxin family protein n=1 Tax=unclassified Cocleimonas TaxID=2639732 RepID=UPI002DBD9F47|nr:MULTISPECIES: thioredoxin fold domain-containing protein [unclassified Cocleimonas]MEB8431550.1 thioredoxin family protein [Cocleimonas sp. KMM 6892]MEC4713678.1 thioredoxin family protein [Cocleimonas sp. KMM 6895]MEC4743009.1 thioredoxin family protein [Cocleimonas sp. KMM 6896]
MKFFTYFLLLLISVNSSASNDSVVIEENDFQQLAQQMKQENRGLVLMLHAEYCSYCKQMDEEILSPMVLSGEYDKRIFIRKLQIDDVRDVVDFSGKTVEPADISGEYHAMLTPTLVFLDYQGKEVVKQMVGINTIELFGAYLDREIDNMMDKLNKY